ncbi:hypothetical protein M8C13_43590 [Crossiella sp. SN42]|uniref:hypothetical protein n=1 Tax=Crossiella sp. SN42 TaxID=2944808 RepID=UPI00207D4F4C|nr:hypothetical protein [Crossiella sp. SN42]MCO1582650.1 hypothetical protein [Crossiella sp. SN42]
MTLPVFPEAEAAQVREYGAKVGQAAVAKLVDTIRDWFGHPEVVSSHALDWDPAAKVLIDKALDDITGCRSNLKAYWSGSAYDSFEIYVNHLEKVFEAATKVMGEMADLLQDSQETMTKVYCEGVRFLLECAAIIIQLTGGIIAGIKEFFLGVAEAVTSAIADFVRNVSDLLNTAATLTQEYKRTGVDLRQKAADLKVPSTIPGSATDAGGWEVRPRPA